VSSCETDTLTTRSDQHVNARPAPTLRSPLPRTRTAERLLDEAAALFREKGYAAATTRELSDRLGIRKASLYHHIDSKEALLHALCLESIQRVSEAVERAIELAPADERLRRAVEAHLVTALGDRDMHATVLFELRQLTSEHLADALAARAAYEEQLRALVESEQDAGRLRTDVSAKQLTLMLLGILNWAILWFTPDGEVGPRELSAIFGTVFLDGAGPVRRRRGAAAGRNGRGAGAAAAGNGRPARRSAGRRPAARRSSRRR